jgi:hypothetical protein
MKTYCFVLAALAAIGLSTAAYAGKAGIDQPGSGRQTASGFATSEAQENGSPQKTGNDTPHSYVGVGTAKLETAATSSLADDLVFDGEWGRPCHFHFSGS